MVRRLRVLEAWPARRWVRELAARWVQLPAAQVLVEQVLVEQVLAAQRPQAPEAQPA